MKKILLLGSLAMTMVLSSCGIHMPSSITENQTQTQVVLAQKNYKIVKKVTGTSKQTYVFCIGGFSKKSMRESALSDMINNAELTGSQAIINTHVQFKNSFYLIVNQCKAEASGVVVEFID